MKYTELQLAEIKRIPLIDILKEKGFTPHKRGKNYACLCPFHDDKNPSLIITPENNLWNCLGCMPVDGKTGGDVIEFVMKYERISFVEAVDKLLQRNPDHKPVGVNPATQLAGRNYSPVNRNTNNPMHMKLLQKVADFYHKTFYEDKRGMDYLKKRGITDSKMYSQFKIGFSNGSLFRTIPAQGEIVDTLKELGILTKNGNELFKECVVFPITDKNGTIVYLYGRKINDDESIKHLYLPGGHRGIFNYPALKSHSEIIITESIIDSLALYQANFKNTIPCYGINGFTDEHVAAFKLNNTKEVIVLFDGDESGKKATKEISERDFSFSCRIAVLPENEDPNSYLLTHPAEELEKIVYGTAKIKKEGSLQQHQLHMIENGFMTELCNRKYLVRGIEANCNKLKVNIRAENCRKFHIDTIDLYSAKARKLFVRDVVSLYKEDVEIIENDIDVLITMTEEYVASRKNGDEKPVFVISDKDRREAVSFGRNKNLIEEIIKDIEKCGYVGEELNKLMCYLAMSSRKMEDPLSVLIISGSGAGKTSLQDTALKLCPPEDLVKLTSLTGKALFYKQETSLKHKVLAVEEEKGAEDADYAIRNLITSNELVIEATVKDPVTGRMTTMTNTVQCNTAVFKTTTNPDTNPETKSRFLILSIDESREQTQRILKYQRYMDTKAGYLEKVQRKDIIKKHQNFQRLLKPVAIFNPYAQLLTYLDDRLLVRRDHPKYNAIIKAVTFIHQMQREIKQLSNGKEYIEVTLEDIALANEIAHHLLGHSLDELSEPSRRLLFLIEEMVRSRCRGEGASPEKEATFTRRDVREYTKWSDYQIKIHIKQLEELEYLIPVMGSRGKQFMYRLAYNGEGRDGASFVLGIANIEDIRNKAKNIGLETVLHN